MRIGRDCDIKATEGVLTNGTSKLEYYTSCPAPTQWVAVGVVISNSDQEGQRRPRRMLVGTGRSEVAAINELTTRFARLCQGQNTTEAAIEPQTAEAAIIPQQYLGVPPGALTDPRDAEDPEAQPPS